MKIKKIIAGLTAVVCCAGMTFSLPAADQTAYAAELVSNGFDVTYNGWYNCGDQVTLTPDETNVHGGTRSMLVSNRLSADDGVESAKGLYLDGGQKYDYNVYVYHNSGADEEFTMTLTYICKDGKTCETQTLVTEAVPSGQWTKLSASYKAPAGATEFIVKLATNSTCDFNFDDFTVTGKQTAQANVVSAAGKGLKDEFANYFRVGNILNGGTVNNTGIKNLILENYNAIECENETKPDATLVQSQCSNTNIGVSLRSCASIFDFCAENNIAVRGHTLVWHSQTPSWFFKDNFQNNGSWVSKSVMDQRLESYIKNMFGTIASQYPSLNLYAYDVCNECVSDDGSRITNNGGSRAPGDNNSVGGQSAWVSVYGDNSFIEKAFTYARKYAPADCKLYYNDYNEFASQKMNCIINTIVKPLYNKGVLDGMGMQSHISAKASGGWDGTDIYLNAMDKYLEIGCDVQVTELDISVKDGYSATDQANKYKAIFQHAMDVNNSGKYNGKVTLVQIWGPNDANSWLSSGSNALLHDGSNQPKAAYNTLINMLPSSEWGDGNNPAGSGPVKEPEVDSDGYWFHDTFESGTDSWSARGGCTVDSSSSSSYKGSKSLSVSGRTDAWNGGQKSLSTRIFKPGEEYAFSACFTNLKGADQVEFKLTLQYEDASGETQYDKIAQTFANQGDYVQLYNPNYKIPAGASSLVLVVETTEELCDFFVDEIIGAPAGTKIDGPTSTVVPATNIRGDLDFDSRISVADLVLLKNGILNGFSKKAAQKNGDIDQSGTVDAADALALQQYLLGMITEFPVAERPVTAMRTISEYTPVVEKNVAISEPDSARAEKAGVQYGTVVSKSYFSNFCGREKKYNVLLPAGYSTDKQYPVLYVMHGYYENQDRMIIKGNGTMYTRQIIGNAIAEGAAEDMIVVFPYIFSSKTLPDCTGMNDENNIAYDNFDTVLTTELMPLIEKEYSVKTGRENTAITGFSMGGRESLNIGMKHPDLFGYVGAICPAPGATGAWKFESEEAAPSLIFITAGGNDEVVYTTPNGYHENFTKNNVPHIWHYYPSGYHGDNSIHAHIYNFVRAVFKA